MIIILPDGFDASLLVSEFYSLAVPFVELAVLMATAFLIVGIFKRS